MKVLHEPTLWLPHSPNYQVQVPPHPITVTATFIGTAFENASLHSRSSQSLACVFVLISKDAILG